MGKKSDDGKIGAIKGTGSTGNVQGADSVGVVGGIKPTSSVGAVKGAGGVGKRRATRIMSGAERENLMRLINEEAEKLFEGSDMSPEKKEVLKSAVKMAVDAGIVTEDDSKNADDSKKK